VYRAVVFDCDGVLVPVRSSWRYIHEHFGLDNEASYSAYMSMEIDGLEFIRRDVALWKSMKPDISIMDIKAILDTIPVKEDAVMVCSELREMGLDICIVSGGLDLLVERVAREVGAVLWAANVLLTDDRGRLTGEGILNVDPLTKDRNIAEIARTLDISPEEIVSVGDSLCDLSMFRVCGQGVAYNPESQEVVRGCDVLIERLEELPRLIDKRRRSLSEAP